MKDVIKFLKLNGFEQDNNKQYRYFNQKCSIEIFQGLTGEYYTVTFFDENDGTVNSTMSSSTANIYWLIGVLTYYDCMDKNYKKVKPTTPEQNSILLLIEDYQRRIKTLNEEINRLGEPDILAFNIQTLERLNSKMACYRTFLSELEKAIAKQEEPQ